jgi:hypothetical protein
MDEREVAEVGEVFHLARGVAAPLVRPAEDGAPGVRLELGHLGQRPARLVKRDPDDPVALLAPERPRARLRRDSRRFLELRDQRAGPVRPVAPAVVGADDLVALDRAEREGRPAMDAQVGEGVGRSGRVPPEDERLVEERHGTRLAAEVARERDRVPAGAERGLEPDRRRRGHAADASPT